MPTTNGWVSGSCSSVSCRYNSPSVLRLGYAVPAVSKARALGGVQGIIAMSRSSTVGTRIGADSLSPGRSQGEMPHREGETGGARTNRRRAERTQKGVRRGEHPTVLVAHLAAALCERERPLVRNLRCASPFARPSLHRWST